MGMVLDEPKGSEKPLEVNSISVLVEDTVRPYIAGTTIDYVKESYGEGFVITGPGGGC